MSTTPRIKSAVDGQAENFATVTAHTAPVMQRFFDLYGSFWQQGVLSPDLKEMTRLRNARITDCGY